MEQQHPLEAGPTHMDVDMPSTHCEPLPASLGALKRSSSAPALNLLFSSLCDTNSDGGGGGGSHNCFSQRRSSSPVLFVPRAAGSSLRAAIPALCQCNGGSNSSSSAAAGRSSMSSSSSSSSSSVFRPVELPAKQSDRSLATTAIASSGGSGSSNSGAPVCTTPVKAVSRLHKIRQEEQVNCAVEREAAHEREVQSSLQISHSWEEMHLGDNASAPCNVDDLCCGSGNGSNGSSRRPRSLSDSLHVFTATGCFPAPSSPSPTVGKQCFSPSMQQPVSAALSCAAQCGSSPSPSPTRRLFTRRSLSPIVSLRPSGLCLKRKLDTDSPENGLCSPKRIAIANSAGPGNLCVMAQTGDSRATIVNNQFLEERRVMAAASHLSFLADGGTSGTDSESDGSSAESTGCLTAESLDDMAPARVHEQQQPAVQKPFQAPVACCRPGSLTRQTSVP